jgi:tetratricopeptide (TPR) repeat protein
MAESARASLYPALGMSDLTIQHLRRAMDLTGHMTEPASGYNQTYLHMRLGFALEEDGDSPAAIDSLQKAVDRGREHPDPDARKLAAQAAYRLHQLLAEAERLSDARRLVEVIEGLVPGLGASERPTFVAMAAHCRGIQNMLENHADDARRSLEQTESMAQQAGAVALARAAAVDLGRLAMRLDRPAEALPHLRRALETAVPHPEAPENQARLADIRLCLANTYMMLERHDDGLAECRRAFDIGRGTGTAGGREIAAIAAMHLGEAADEPPMRRRFYQVASQLGRLSGRARGREVADTVDARLREMAD